MYYKNLLKNPYDSIILICFTLIFTLFFFLSNGLFYGFDSNETFSSIWHSYNFLNYSFDLHKGLADETFSNLESAHSFIHTHQGNVPRFLGILLILFGFESVQSHIYITYLILGIPTFYILIKLLNKISDSKEFTYISIIFLFTNYILFFQWLFVTYRIWYFYLIFSTFYYLIQLDKNRFFKILLFLNLIILFYFEYIFALFLSIALFIFTLYLNDFAIKKVMKKYYIYLLAPIISIAVLCFQLISFYGFDSFIQDINYTYNTRNTGLNISNEIIEFYNKNFIVYWHNFLEHNLNTEIFFRNDLRYYGLYFISFIIYGFMIPIKIYVLPSIKYHYISKDLNSLFSNKFLLSIIILIFIWVTNFIIFSTHSSSILKINFFKYVVSSMLVSIFVINFIKINKNNFYDYIIFNVVVILFSCLIFYLKSYAQPGDLFLFEGSLYSIILILFVNFISLASLPKFSNIRFKFHSLFYFFISLFLATLIIYILSPGYLWSGYISRAAPFLIFIKFLVYGFSLFFVYHIFITNLQSENFLKRYLVYVLSSTIMFTWLYSQYYLIDLNKFNNLSFLNVMDDDKYKGKIFVSNFYPASYSFISKSTGFQDDRLLERKIISNNGETYLTFDDKYLWHKGDKKSYYKPDFLICNSINNLAQSNNPTSQSCNNFDLIKNIDNYDFANIIDYELFGGVDNKVYRWVIIKFDYSNNFQGLIDVQK